MVLLLTNFLSKCVSLSVFVMVMVELLQYCSRILHVHTVFYSSCTGMLVKIILTVLRVGEKIDNGVSSLNYK